MKKNQLENLITFSIFKFVSYKSSLSFFHFFSHKKEFRIKV